MYQYVKADYSFRLQDIIPKKKIVEEQPPLEDRVTAVAFTNLAGLIAQPPIPEDNNENNQGNNNHI